MPNEPLDGFEVFAHEDSLRRYEQQVDSDDDARFWADMDRLAAQDPEAARWLEEHGGRLDRN